MLFVGFLVGLLDGILVGLLDGARVVGTLDGDLVCRWRVVGKLVALVDGEAVCLLLDVEISSARQPAIAKEYF